MSISNLSFCLHTLLRQQIYFPLRIPLFQKSPIWLTSVSDECILSLLCSLNGKKTWNSKSVIAGYDILVSHNNSGVFDDLWEHSQSEESDYEFGSTISDEVDDDSTSIHLFCYQVLHTALH